MILFVFAQDIYLAADATITKIQRPRTRKDSLFSRGPRDTTWAEGGRCRSDRCDWTRDYPSRDGSEGTKGQRRSGSAVRTGEPARRSRRTVGGRSRPLTTVLLLLYDSSRRFHTTSASLYNIAQVQRAVGMRGGVRWHGRARARTQPASRLTAACWEAAANGAVRFSC